MANVFQTSMVTMQDQALTLHGQQLSLQAEMMERDNRKDIILLPLPPSKTPDS
jgi:hypothetical protein